MQGPAGLVRRAQACGALDDVSETLVARGEVGERLQVASRRGQRSVVPARHAPRARPAADVACEGRYYCPVWISIWITRTSSVFAELRGRGCRDQDAAKCCAWVLVEH